MEHTNSEKEFNPQYSAPLVEQITEFLTTAIVEGRLKNGQRLVESELQRRFKVSRAPIRESFRIMERNGLVISIPRKGTYVRKITKKYIEENFPIRALLESLAARLAIEHLKIEDIQRMELALSMMTEAVRSNDFKSYLKYHSEFHEIFIYACKNDTLIEILQNLRRQAIWFRFTYLAASYVEESFEYLIQVHREILGFFIKKDADRVESYVKEHILTAGDRFLKALASQSDK